MATTRRRYDVFICHASEDKDAVARPLAKAFRSLGLDVWYDEFTLTVGDSLRQKIDSGLAASRFGVVILSPAFFRRPWPQYELDGLVERATAEARKVVLPVWHRVDEKDVRAWSPSLACLLAARTADGMDAVAAEILRAIRSETPAPVISVVGKPTRAGRTAAPAPEGTAQASDRHAALRYKVEDVLYCDVIPNSLGKTFIAKSGRGEISRRFRQGKEKLPPTLVSDMARLGLCWADGSLTEDGVEVLRRLAAAPVRPARPHVPRDKTRRPRST